MLCNNPLLPRYSFKSCSQLPNSSIFIEIYEGEACCIITYCFCYKLNGAELYFVSFDPNDGREQTSPCRSCLKINDIKDVAGLFSSRVYYFKTTKAKFTNDCPK